MPKKDERKCRRLRIGGVIAGLFVCGAAGAGIGTAFPDSYLAAITIFSIVLGGFGGFLTADGNTDACSDDDDPPGKKNEKSARIGFIIIGIPFGSYIAIAVLRLVLGPDPSYTIETALAGALAGAIAGDLISRWVRARV